MNMNDIQHIFNRAWSYTFSKQKLLLMAVVLALCGVVAVLCRALAFHSGTWVGMSLAFLPIFLCSGLLLASGVVLTRIYHDEIKNKPSTLKSIINKSWELIIGISYFAVPLILAYLILWILLGVFILLSNIPVVGDVFAVVLAFAPFVINVASLLLCALTGALLFFVPPAVALNGLDKVKIGQSIARRLSSDVFSNLLLLLIALLPLILVIAWLTGAALLTGKLCMTSHTVLNVALQWFFIMLPFVILLSPVAVFFFNFAAEAHVLMNKKR